MSFVFFSQLFLNAVLKDEFYNNGGMCSLRGRNLNTDEFNFLL